MSLRLGLQRCAIRLAPTIAIDPTVWHLHREWGWRPRRSALTAKVDFSTKGCDHIGNKRSRESQVS